MVKIPTLSRVPRLLVVGLVLAITLASVVIVYAGRQVIPYHTVLWGSGAEYSTPSNMVLNDAVGWSDLWTKAFCSPYGCPSTPQINFTSRTVIAVFVGQRPSTGYFVNITQIDQFVQTVVVHITMTVPGPSCGRLESVTSPFHIIDTPKIARSVSFTSQTTMKNC